MLRKVGKKRLDKRTTSGSEKRASAKPRRATASKSAKTASEGASQQKKRKSFDATTPKGMHDILPAETPFWNRIREAAVKIAEFYGFREIETPILEKLELFVRGVGEATDIVEKEMYSFRTKGGDELVLRPEGTTPVVRSFLQHGMHKLPQPQKLYYWGPFFRHERPQAGRYRQFHQFGLEVVGGESDPAYDAQVMLVSFRWIEELKVKPLMIHINSVGCRGCRPGYKAKLVNYYQKCQVCADCERRKKQNPLRLLDCKEKGCEEIKKEAPSILDSLCVSCRTHLKNVLEYLEEAELPYMLNPYLVRGLDYYNRTVFEIFSEDEGLALCAGGRYDYLAEMLGGRSTPAVGAAAGVERIVDLLQATGRMSVPEPKAKVFLVHVGDLAKKKSLPLMEELRKSNISLDVALGRNSLSSQLEIANKKGVALALILGQKEVYEESVIIRDMDTGVQESVPVAKVVDEVKKRLKS